VRAVFEDSYPPHSLDAVPLILGREVTHDPSQARRTATALFNAYVHPDVADFLYRAEDYLRANGYRRPLLIQHNDGSCSRVAKTVAGKTYNSGPTGGLLGARAVSALYGGRPLVTFDMGGTSLDVGVVGPHAIPVRTPGLVEDVEVAFPLPDLLTLGSGGGSIATLADDGAMRVGPESAGAYPGPACFGRGGTSPTVTDADVVLGILRPEAFLGGRVALDRAAATEAMRTLAAEGQEPQDVAERILQTVNEQMGAKLAEILQERGVEPEQATIVAFGGNGPTHAAGIAQQAGVRDVLVLPFAPVFSAFGASTAPVRHVRRARAVDNDDQTLRTLVLRDMRSEGIEPEKATVTVHETEHGGEHWLTAEALADAPAARMPRTQVGSGAAEERTETPVHWPGHGSTPTTVAQRASLQPQVVLDGPALIEAPETTCAVPPGWSARLDEHGNLRVTHQEALQ
jgi:N-methylhydantoinase A/oxoprolinase/acetone carboxylase beta subunit